MKLILQKIGAYLILIIGILIASGLTFISVYVYVFYPDSTVQKRALVGTGTLIAAAIVLVVAIAMFESIIEIVEIEQHKQIRNNEKMGGESSSAKVTDGRNG